MHFALILPFLICAGCSSALHIRKSDYYPIGKGESFSAQKTIERQRHHPRGSYFEVFKKYEGRPNYKETIHYFLFGSFPSRPRVDLTEACRDKSFRQAYVAHTFIQSGISILTLGIYTPMTVEVWCGPTHI